MTKHAPATPLPWKDGPVFQTDHRGIFFDDTSKPGKWQRRVDSDSLQRGLYEPDDAAYIAHAANAYPRLVEALRMIMRDAGNRDVGQVSDLLRELGEE